MIKINIYPVVKAGVGLEDLVYGLPRDPCVVPVLGVVVVVRVAGTQGLHLRLLPLTKHSRIIKLTVCLKKNKHFRFFTL